MGNESGTWIMREATSQVSSSLEHLATAATEKHSFEVYGVAPDDPECIHTVDEAIEYINEIGLLPEEVKWHTENFLLEKQVLFPRNGFHTL